LKLCDSTKYYADSQSKKNEMGGTCERFWRQERFWWGDMRERDHLGNLVIDGMIILKWILKKLDREALTGVLWRWIGTGGGCLHKQYLNSGSINVGNF